MASLLYQPFDKTRRLLNAADYSSVFDKADYKVSNKHILCLSRDNKLHQPRLGLVIAKKNVKHAVQRNRLKRIIRESFRLQQHNLPSVDIVVLARRGVDQLDNSQLEKDLAKIWQRLSEKAFTSPVKKPRNNGG